MAKAKKTAKKTSAPKKKPLKVVEAAAPAELAPTPTDYVQAALAHATKCLEQWELCVLSLNDGKPFFATVPDNDRKALTDALTKFSQTAGFAIDSLKDEISIALGQAKAAGQTVPTPALDIAVPYVPRALVEPAAAPTVAQLEDVAGHFGLVLSMLCECDIKAFQYEQAGKALTFIKNMHDRTQADLSDAKNRPA